MNWVALATIVLQIIKIILEQKGKPDRKEKLDELAKALGNRDCAAISLLTDELLAVPKKG